MATAIGTEDRVHIRNEEVNSESPRTNTTQNVAEQFLLIENSSTFPKAAIHASRYSELFGAPKDKLLSRKVKSISHFLGGATIGGAIALLSKSTGINTVLYGCVGSLPSLAVNSLSVAGGMAVKDRAPIAGWSMISYGVLQHLMNSSYSWSAATMSSETLIEKAGSGHDFANLAVNLSEMTGLPAQAIAIGTSIAWTSLVPVLAIGLYFHQKSKQLDVVPDHVAVQNLLFKAMSDKSSAELITRSLETYPRRKKLDSLWKNGLGKNDESFSMSYDLHLELRRYTEHLINSLPQKKMNASKKEVLMRYAKLQKPDRIGQALSIVSVAGTIAALASQILKVFGATIAPFLATASTALSFSTPLLTGVSVISGGYETYKDLATSSRKVPKRAKVVSIAKLVVTAVSAIGLAAGAIVPALYLVGVASVLANIIGGLALGYARQKMIRHRFRLLNSIEQGNWNMMVKLLEIYNKDKGNIDVKKSDAAYRGLYRWMQFQKSADKKGFLKDNQRQKLIEIGLLPKENP